MGFFQRISNVLNGVAAETGDAIMENETMQNAELRGSFEKMKSDLNAARQSETTIGGKVKTLSRTVEALRTQYESCVNAAMKADEKGDAESAERFALDAQAKEEEISANEQSLNAYKQALEKQKKNIKTIRSNIATFERTKGVVESQKAINKAKQAANASLVEVSGEDSNNALSILRKQQEKAKEQADKLDYVDDQLAEAQSHKSAEDYIKMESASAGGALAALKAKQKA